MSETYEDYAPAAGDNSLAQVARLAELQEEAEMRVQEAEDELKARKERLRDIAERQLPELMAELGLEDFKTSTGLRVQIKETVRASIPEKFKKRAMAWLTKNNQEGIIQTSVTVDFPKGDLESAKELEQRLLDDYGEAIKTSYGVHSSTLRAFVAEMLANGAELPMELFGASVQRASKITR